MSQYVADRFGNNLTRYDVQNLRNEIIKPFLKSKIIELPRGKKEILKLSYSIDPIRTLEYLMRKSDNDLKEVLRCYRNEVLTVGVNTQNPKKAVEMLEKFEKTEIKYQSLVKGEDFHDISPFPPKRIDKLRERVESLNRTPPRSHSVL